MTELEFVRETWPEVKDEDEAAYILWNWTSYPMESDKEYREQLEDLKTRSGGDIKKAESLANQDLEKAMKEKPF